MQWNYVKFLVDRNGRPVKRFGSLYDPIDFEDDVRACLSLLLLTLCHLKLQPSSILRGIAANTDDTCGVLSQVRLLLAGKETLSPECKRHPGRKACKVDAMRAA